MTVPPPLTPQEEEYYDSFKALIRDRMPDGRSLFVELKSAFDRFFAEEQILLSPKERYRLFQWIVKEVMNEMSEEVRQLKP